MTMSENLEEVKTKETALHDSKITSINTNLQRQIASLNEQAAQKVKEEEVRLSQKKVQWAEMEQRLKMQNMEKQFQEGQARLQELNQAIADGEARLQELEQPK